jgi:glycosyltransferase involved in cell wall biosynthesis
MQIRTDRADRIGGDTLHAERTAAELRKLGVEVDVTGEEIPDPSAYELVHLYNTAHVAPTLRRALRAHGCGVPVVIETIYWDTSYAQAPVVARHQAGLRRVALGLAELAICNSRLEAEALEADFPDVVPRLRVVPVGVDGRTGLEGGDGDAFCKLHGLEPGFVLCAGRKEQRKNQLRLIQACGRLGLALVLVGGEHPEHEEYVAECRAAAASAGGEVAFLPHLEGAELAGAYAAAHVHAQPSIRETVGLSSFEAALAGCNVVTTRNSGIFEYLGADAWYCDPWSEESIAEAVADAAAAPAPDGEVAARLRAEFSWRRTAAKALVVYEEAMREHEQRDGEPRLPAAQYAEHLEELVQLQLEAIAFRDESLEGFQAHTAYLDAQVAQREAELGEARARLETTRAELEQERAASAAARAELERMQATRLFRWSAPLRAVYARLRNVAG